MRITVRMDDITPDMDWNSFEAFERLFDRYGIQPLLGVVPDNRDPKLSIDLPREEFWERLRRLQKKGWRLAMHGCHHVYRTKKGGVFPLNKRSEFAGLSEGEQRALMTEGKKKLASHGIHTDIFMAPGHTFDRTTLKILRELRFQYVTDGYGKKPYLYDGIVFLPISFLRSRMFSEKDGYTTLVIHSNHTDSGQLDRYEKMFCENSSRFAPYTEFMRQKPVKRGFCARALEYGMAAGKRFAGGLRG